MSLLQSLSYKEYQKALAFNTVQCESVAKLADLRNISFDNTKRPGQHLIKALDRQGTTLDQYKEFISNIQQRRHTIYQPNVKIAVIIGNDRYVNLSRLVTPPTDCSLLSNNLKNLGFNVVILKNTTSKPLKKVLGNIISAVPEGSYCVIFYAGHGGNSGNQLACMLSVDCPTDNIRSEHCITQKDILETVALCKPDLCLFVMDMCRINLDGLAHPEITSQTQPNEEDLTKLYDIKNLIICYSSQEYQSAYEAVQLYCSYTLDTNMTYELKTGDLDIVVPDGSQYVNAFCRRVNDDEDVGTVMDKVHADVANGVKFQRPIKIQHFNEVKRSLHDPAIDSKYGVCKAAKGNTYNSKCTQGDPNPLLDKLKEIGKEFYEDFL